MPKTYQQIQLEIQKLQAEAERLRAKEANDVAARIREAITVYGFTPEVLFGKSTGRRSAKAAAAGRPAKYKDGQGNAWSGFGPKPGWFKAALAAGKTEADLRA